MIENKLSDNEFNKLISPVLYASNVEEVFSNFSCVFSQNINSIEDLWDYKKTHLITYKGFVVSYNTVNQNTSKPVFQFSFSSIKKWQHFFINPTKEILMVIKKIIVSNINDIDFAKRSYCFGDMDKNGIIPTGVCYYDSNACEYGVLKYEIARSPTTIFIFSDKNCHEIRLSFHSACYEKYKNKIVLKEDWYNYREKEFFDFN